MKLYVCVRVYVYLPTNRKRERFDRNFANVTRITSLTKAIYMRNTVVLIENSVSYRQPTYSEYQLSILTSTNNFQVLRTIRPFCRFRSPSRPDEESHPQGYEHFIGIVSGKKFFERQYLLKVILFFCKM